MVVMENYAKGHCLWSYTKNKMERLRGMTSHRAPSCAVQFYSQNNYVIQREDWTWPGIENLCKTFVSRDQGWNHFIYLRVGSEQNLSWMFQSDTFGKHVSRDMYMTENLYFLHTIYHYQIGLISSTVISGSCLARANC